MTNTKNESKSGALMIVHQVLDKIVDTMVLDQMVVFEEFTRDMQPIEEVLPISYSDADAILKDFKDHM